MAHHCDDPGTKHRPRTTSGLSAAVAWHAPTTTECNILSPYYSPPAIPVVMGRPTCCRSGTAIVVGQTPPHTNKCEPPTKLKLCRVTRTSLSACNSLTSDLRANASVKGFCLVISACWCYSFIALVFATSNSVPRLFGTEIHDSAPSPSFAAVGILFLDNTRRSTGVRKSCGLHTSGPRSARCLPGYVSWSSEGQPGCRTIRAAAGAHHRRSCDQLAEEGRPRAREETVARAVGP